MSLGMNAETGRAITDEEHLRQSINQILLTPIGSRTERRPFGSLLPDLIDHPFNDYTTVLLYAATATALIMHEPRLQLTRVSLNTGPENPGSSDLQIDGVSNIGGRRRNAAITVPIRTGLI